MARPTIACQPSIGMNGTMTNALAMQATLNAAGASAGRKNDRSEFSIPMHATAIAISTRNGNMTWVSVVVSSSLPGVAAYSGAIHAVSGPASTMPATVMIPVTTMRPVMTIRPSSHAASLPLVWSSRVKVGTKAALIAPSAKRSRTRLGSRNATLYASIT